MQKKKRCEMPELMENAPKGTARQHFHEPRQRPTPTCLTIYDVGAILGLKAAISSIQYVVK